MAAAHRLVTLTTDFGARDTFVGQMKGVLLGLAPDATIVDLTHEVPPHDVEAGAFLLETALAAFPPGTVHVAVVDPGVGTDRPAIAVATPRAFLVAPDNGVLSRALRTEPVVAMHALDAPDLRRRSGAATFDGRDLFSPAAARLARGEPIATLGRRLPTPAFPPRERPRPDARGETEVRVLWVDRFGNAVLDLRPDEIDPALPPGALEARAPGGTARGLVRAFEHGGPEATFLVAGSAGYLEVARRRHSAAAALGLEPGSRVRVRIASPPA